ncbi:MAG: citrate lyase acyl carrier protein [Synergistales bacterium]|nr:citrate lyase acyl carrier protein [Synergistales bacterium]
MQSAQAGTVESMDCLVSVSPGAAGSGLDIQLSGSSVARFTSVMRAAVEETARAMDAGDVAISVQDNGALDIILRARVETALRRYKGGANL